MQNQTPDFSTLADGRDADVMLTATVLARCGMSPLDRELWAEEHGRHYAAGAKRRLLAKAAS